MTRTIVTAKGPEPAVDPQPCNYGSMEGMEEFEAFDLFTHAIPRGTPTQGAKPIYDYCVSEGRSGRAIPNAQGEYRNYMTRGLARAAASSWLRRVGAEAFGRRIALYTVEKEQNHAV